MCLLWWRIENLKIICHCLDEFKLVKDIEFVPIQNLIDQLNKWTENKKTHPTDRDFTPSLILTNKNKNTHSLFFGRHFVMIIHSWNFLSFWLNSSTHFLWAVINVEHLVFVVFGTLSWWRDIRIWCRIRGFALLLLSPRLPKNHSHTCWKIERRKILCSVWILQFRQIITKGQSSWFSESDQRWTSC